MIARFATARPRGLPRNRVATWRPRDHAVAQSRDCERGQPATQPGRERPAGLATEAYSAHSLRAPRPSPRLPPPAPSPDSLHILSPTAPSPGPLLLPSSPCSLPLLPPKDPSIGFLPPRPQAPTPSPGPRLPPRPSPTRTPPAPRLPPAPSPDSLPMSRAARARSSRPVCCGGPARTHGPLLPPRAPPAPPIPSTCFLPRLPPPSSCSLPHDPSPGPPPRAQAPPS